MLYSIFSKFFSQVIPNDVMTKMVDEIQLPVDIVEIILEFIREKNINVIIVGSLVITIGLLMAIKIALNAVNSFKEMD